MSTVTYREAMRMALDDALRRDERVFLMGEDVGRYGGCYAVSLGLLEEFGPERIRDTPLSESGFVGAGIGAALGGMRPIVEIMTVNFSLLALDQIVNNAATLLYMSGGQFNVPIVIRMTTGAGRQLGAQHSHSLEGWYTHIPGIRVLAPATLEDARGMLWPALCDPDPVLFFEHGALYNVEGELADDAGPVDLDSAVVRREGADVTVVVLRRDAPGRPGCRRRARPGGHLGGGDRPAQPATARHRHDRVVGRAHPPGGRGGRGMAKREPLRGGVGPHRRGGVLRPRRPRRARVQGRGAHALCQAPRGRGHPAGARRRRRRSRTGGVNG